MDYKTDNLVVVVPIGNAGNVTAIMEGFLEFFSDRGYQNPPVDYRSPKHPCQPDCAWKETRRLYPDERKAERCSGRHDRKPGFLSQSFTVGGKNILRKISWRYP